jgi:uncharacterized protein (TIGR02117 family)
MKILKRTFKSFLWLLSGLILFIIVYLIAAFLFSQITINKYFKEDKTPSAITIYVMTNGVHTDIAVPLRNEYYDWSTQIKTSYTIAKDTTVKYVAFGWGDKGFFLNTPEWSDLKFSTAFNAMFFLSTTAMHVTLYKRILTDADCKKISIDPETYRQLIYFIDNSFQRQWGNYILIPGHSYGRYDCFFEAKGTYNLFYTCNTWTNKALKSSHMKACFWTPFDKGILKIYESNP